MARINLGKVVPEKGVDYFTDEEKTELKQEIENDLSTQINKNKTDIQTLQTESGNSIEMSLDQLTYKLTLILKNKAGQQISSQEIDLPNENSITDISYNNGKLIITKQSGTTTEVDITGLINGLVTETDFETFTTALETTLNTIEENIQNNYKVITKLQEDIEDLTERVEDAENNQLTNTPTPATSHYLQDSADARFRKFIPIGRTTQESTTGKNLFNEVQLLEATDWQVNNGVYSGTIGNWFSKFKSGFTGLSFETNTQYTISLKGYTTGGTPRIKIVYTDNTSSTLAISASSMTEYSITSTSGKTISSVQADFGSGSAQTLSLSEVQIEKGTSKTSWEKYTGGEPAPNPNYPYAIKNTGDNGSVNEKIENKNFLPTENIDTTIAGVTYKSQDDGTILANGEKYGGAYVNLSGNTITLEEGTYSSRMFLLEGTIKKGGNDNKPTVYLISQDDNTKSYNLEEIGNPGKTRTIPAGTYFIRIAVWNDNIVFTNAKIGLMLIKGSTIPDKFVPHSEQNISFPLAPGQKLMEGDYPDDDEKVHHVRGEVVLDGTVGGYNADYNWFYLSFTNLQIQKPKTLNILSNYFKYYNRNEFANDTSLNGISFNTTDISTASTFVIRNTNCTNANEYKTWLAEVLPIVQYELAEEQTEDFTEEQKEAWEQIKKARTYKNVTHISSEDETPANVEIEYVRDINTIDDRITALEAKVDLLEE